MNLKKHMNHLDNDYIKYRNLWMWEYNHINLDMFQNRIEIGRKHGKYRSKNPIILKFEIMKEGCKYLGKKRYTAYPGGYYICGNSVNVRYYCNRKTCPMLFNRNGANE